MGAEVIKVERPELGDETRGWGPPFDGAGRSAYFLSVNRNKLSIAVDLDRREDLDLVRALVESADVVLENFRAGVLEQRGISAVTLLQRYHRLVWCTISGFGPGSARPGYDFIAQAEAGWMAITGEPDGQPMKTGVALADVIAGKDAAIAILGALLARELAGEPLSPEDRRLHISLLHSAAASLVNVAQNVLVARQEASRWGNAHPNLVPYQLFHASDRPVVIAVGSDAQWRALCRALELDRLADDPALATNAGRVRERQRVVAAIASCIAQRAGSHWMRSLGAARVPCGLVNTVSEALQLVPGSVSSGVAPAAYGRVRLEPPRLDEHGDVIRAHGWNAFAHLAPTARG
jgi:crotonobetainyl-CoA:carnitine CoA-transferase CaiB-like acyl-CoA transferase